MHCNETAVMKSYKSSCQLFFSSTFSPLSIGTRLTHVFANVLNLKDRSIPWPSCVNVHRLLALRLSRALVRRASSEPSENLGLEDMVRFWIMIKEKVDCRKADVLAPLNNVFIMGICQNRLQGENEVTLVPPKCGFTKKVQYTCQVNRGPSRSTCKLQLPARTPQRSLSASPKKCNTTALLHSEAAGMDSVLSFSSLLLRQQLACMSLHLFQTSIAPTGTFIVSTMFSFRSQS